MSTRSFAGVCAIPVGMEQTWRWFGPRDPISLTKVRQAGATGVVTALHHLPPGMPWSEQAIAERQSLIESAGLRWSVVESLAVHGDVRLGLPGHERYLDAYLTSLRNLAARGVAVVCYNFMPVIDWTRTQLAWRTSAGASSLRFDMTQWVAFDVFVLQRAGAADEYSPQQLQAAESLLQSWTDADKQQLVQTVSAGLPGANESGYSLDGLREALACWRGVTPQQLRDRLVSFLEVVTPLAEQLGMVLCIHPDDPPRPLLGLPRIASCRSDFDSLFERVPSKANGLTLCVGSLGAGPANDPVALAERFASRVHFAHLRSVVNEPDGSFYEANHLEGDVDMVRLVQILVREERRRRAAGEAPTQIAMRPDHGHTLEGDIGELPGYSWLGRLKGLAELRGLLYAVERLG